MENKISLIRLNDGLIMPVKTKEEMVDSIIGEYHSSENVVGELMDGYSITGLSIIDVVDVWATVMRRTENDCIVQIYGDHGTDELFDEISKGEEEGDLVVLG